MAQALERLNLDLSDLPTLESVSALVPAGRSAASPDHILRALRSDKTLAANWRELVRPLSRARTATTPEAELLAQVGAQAGGRLLRLAALRTALPPRDELDEWLWSHLRRVGILAWRLAVSTGAVFPEDAYVAGLVHDCGKLAMKALDPEAWASVAAEARATGHWAAPEWHAYGYEHTDMGGRFLECWELEPRFVTVAEKHHASELLDPSEIGRARREAAGLDSATARLVAVVHLANELVHRWEDPDPAAWPSAHELVAARFLGIDPERISRD